MLMLSIIASMMMVMGDFIMRTNWVDVLKFFLSGRVCSNCFFGKGI